MVKRTLQANVDVRHNGNPDNGPIGPCGFTAMLTIAETVGNSDVRGCPLGRGDTREMALADLAARIRHESGIDVECIEAPR